MYVPATAAKELGVSANQIRYLIRKGKLKAKKEPIMGGGFYYVITPSELEKLRDKVGYGTTGQTKGRPRK